MGTHGREKFHNPHGLTVSDGREREPGEARTPEDELERLARELFFAMRRKDGTSVSENFRSVTRKNGTRPLKMLIRRLKEAKAARNDAHNYTLAKDLMSGIDAYVDHLYRKPTTHVTGEHTPPPAAPARKRAA